MKRFLKNIILMGILLTSSCFYDEAETINPADETYTNTATAVGNITTLTATVSDITVSNKYIVVNFSSAIDTSTIIYGTSVQVESPASTALTEGTDYTAIVSGDPANKITLDFTQGGAPLNPGSTDSIIVIMTNAIKSLNNSSVGLTPINVSKTLP